MKFGYIGGFFLTTVLNIALFAYAGAVNASRIIAAEQYEMALVVVFMMFIHCLGIFISVVMVQATLINIRDKDFLKTLPVQPYEILISKAVVGFFTALLTSLSSIIAFMAVFAHQYGYGLWWIGSAVAVSILSSIPLYVIGIALAIALRKIVDGRKNAKQIRMGLQVILVLVLMAVNGIYTIEPEISNSIYGVLRWIMPTSYLAAYALMENAAWAWLALLALAILSVWVANKLFVAPLLSFDVEGTRWKAAVYSSQAHKNIKTPSVLNLLLKYNFKQLFAMPSYFITCCIGLIYTLVIAVGTSVYGRFFYEGDLSSFFDGDAPVLAMSILLFALYAAGSTCSMTGISIAVEGKSFYHMKCAPITPRQLIAPKILVNWILAFSFVFVSWTALNLTFFGIGLLYIVGVLGLLVSSLRVSLLGMVIALIKPRIDVDPAKALHSFAAIASPLGNALIVLGVFLGIKNLLLPAGVSFIVAAVLVGIFELVVSALLSLYLLKVVDKKIESIEVL